MAETPTTATRPALKAAMTPLKASDMTGPQYLRMLVLGFQKVGKSCTVISTAPGPVYVINTDQENALEPVLDFNQDFLHNFVKSSQEMNDALEVARQLVKADEVQTVVWDTMSGFSPIVEAEAFKATLTSNQKEDGRKASPLFKKIMRSTLVRLLKLKCHVIVISHYLDVGGSFEEEEPETKDGKEVKKSAKQSPGIVPMIYGSFKAEAGTKFDDVVFMEKQITGPGTESRYFVTGLNGVYGPGCRSLTGNQVIPADVSNFLKLAEKKRAERRAPFKMAAAAVKPAVSNGAARPTVAR